MKKLFFLVVVGLYGSLVFAQPEPIPFKVASYQISTRQTASQYLRAELIIREELDADGRFAPSWEIVLYRKDGTGPDRIKLEKFDDIGRNLGVFRTVTITEAAGTSGSNLFAYMPAFEGNRIRVDLCDTRTEGVKRRLIIEII